MLAPAAAPPAYSRPQIALHWLSVGLLSALVLTGELRHLVVGQSWATMRSLMITHIGCGMALLFATLLRAALRALSRRASGARACLQDTCAHAVHLALYAFILGSCLLGWIIVNAKGFAVPVPFTDMHFPRLVAADPALVQTAIRAHDLLNWLLYGLLALHIGAALWHHFVSRDDTLERMGWKRKTRGDTRRGTRDAPVGAPKGGLVS